MSGSPPLPPKTSLEAGDRSQVTGPYQTTSHAQNVYGSAQSQALQPPPEDIRPPAPLPATLPPPPPPSMRSYQPPPDSSDRMGYYRQPDDPLARSYSYPPPGGHSAPPPAPYPPMQAPPAAPQASYPPTAQSQPSTGTPYGSPKPSRKAKGHVPSACVPCKRAHLRCDTQRPCSRCVMNGKEDACVDVQHKKRGRPRLRDDRDARFDGSRFPSAPDAAALRRPLGMSYPGGSIASGYEDTFRRSSQSYRVLKSQPSEPMAGRYIDRASSADANVYAPPLSIATRATEPVAFLTTDLDVVRASMPFIEATGISSPPAGRKLYDLVVPAERERVTAYQRQMQDEQARQEPRYLPPIYGKMETERVIQGLGFNAEDVSRFQLDRHDRLTFNSTDGQPRNHAVQFGLAKVESIYLVVLRLNMANQFPYPSPSPHSREAPFAYPPQPPPPQQAFTQRTPVSATFDPNRPPPRYDQAPAGPRPGGAPGQISGLSPGVSPGIPSYQPSSNRPDYGVAPTSYQIPRSELPPTTRPPQAQSFQLPPIRAQPAAPHPDVPAADSTWQRDDRSAPASASASASSSARVDIGGLMNKPDQPQPHRPQ